MVSDKYSLLFFAACTCLLGTFSSADYWEKRSDVLREEASLFLGSNVKLTSEEEQVNSLLMEAKKREYSMYFESEMFPPARHFFHSKADIEQSEVFRIIKVLPKGGLLHGHDTGIVSLDYLVSNLTYRNKLYACVNISSEIFYDSLLVQFRFSSGEPEIILDNCKWMLMEWVRQQYGKESVDEWLHKELSLITPNPIEKYPNGNVAWIFFNDLFTKVNSLVTYKPIFREYYLQVLSELRQDNIMYLELRGTLPKLYDLEGNEYEGAAILEIYKEATEEFVKEHQEFFGAKFIYAPPRNVNNATFNDYIIMVRDFHYQFPNFLAGFDLVGQEDKGRPLIDFVEGIMTLPSDLKFFFHAGETNWQGLTDLNLVDAVLLNTTRIGHGYALTKHPLLMKIIKERQIGIEVNPISNQVLRLVDDLRNHPAAGLLADNFPIVISSDDPTFWGAIGLSYDFYEVFMGMTGEDADLRFLKQISQNSITYSAMSQAEKENAYAIWKNKWRYFIMKILIDYNYGYQVL